MRQAIMREQEQRRLQYMQQMQQQQNQRGGGQQQPESGGPTGGGQAEGVSEQKDQQAGSDEQPNGAASPSAPYTGPSDASSSTKNIAAMPQVKATNIKVVDPQTQAANFPSETEVCENFPLSCRIPFLSILLPPHSTHYPPLPSIAAVHTWIHLFLLGPPGMVGCKCFSPSGNNPNLPFSLTN